MTIKEFLLQYKEKFGAIRYRYRVLYPIFEDYEEEFYKKEKGQDFIEEKYDIFFKVLKNRFKELFDIEEKETDEIIFVLNLKEAIFDSGYEDYYIESFKCNKKDILEKMDEEFGLWNDNLPRIEHYAYDYMPINELLGTELFYSENICEIDVLCTILHQIVLHGFTEKQKEESFDNLCAQLDEAMKDYEEGRCFDADDVFEELEQEILDSCKTEEDRQKIIEQRQERKKNEYRDKLFLHLVMKINHKECVKLIEEWCVNEILKGNIR